MRNAASPDVTRAPFSLAILVPFADLWNWLKLGWSVRNAFVKIDKKWTFTDSK